MGFALVSVLFNLLPMQKNSYKKIAVAATVGAALAVPLSPLWAQTTAPGQTGPGQTGPQTAPASPGTPNAPQGPSQNPAGPTAPGSPPAPAPPSGQNMGQTTSPANRPVNTQGGLKRPGSENESPIFDLARTVQAAQDSSSGLVQARRNVEIDNRRADAVAAQGKLGISADARATRYDAATRVQINPQSPPVTTLPNHQESLAVSLTQRIDFFGQIRAATSQARLQTFADRFVVDQLRNSRILQAQITYFDLLRAEHQEQVAEAALRSARAQSEVARKLYEGGIGQKIDFLRAQTNVATGEQEVTRTANARAIARTNFNDLVGRPLDAPVVLTDVQGVTVGTDLVPPDARAPVGATPAVTTFAPFAPVPADVAIDLAASIAEAQRVRPEVLQYETLVRANEIGVTIARGALLPTFAISAAGNYYPTTSFQTPRDRVASLTAAITIPLYDGGATRARVDEARLRTENARTVADSARADVALSVRTAYLNLLTASRQITSANAALTQAIAARQLAQVRYEGQVGLFLEVTDAQTALTRAEAAQVDAVYNYLTARAQFENAVGAPRVTGF